MTGGTNMPDWEAATAGLVAGFRQSVGTDTDDPRFIELVGELSLASDPSASSGHAMTFRPARVPPSRSTIHRSASSP